MKWVLRIPQALVIQMRRDLGLAHAFAFERVAFAHGVTEAAGDLTRIVLVRGYWSVDDAHYLQDTKVGARISGAAIREAMQHALTHGVSVFHVHMHDHHGVPGFSQVDLVDTPRIVQSLQVVQPQQAHGAMLLSRDSVAAAVWLPGSSRPSSPGRVVVVGQPMQFVRGLDIHG